MNEYSFHSFDAVQAELLRRLDEAAPARVQVLTGPRQVGKTTLLLEVQKHLGNRVVYAAADAAEGALSGWWELLWRRAERLATGVESAVLLIDEISYLSGWARRLKAEIDRVRRERIRLHVVVSGSSSLLIGRGARETMAGRFERLRLTHWPAVELVRKFHVRTEQAVEQYVRFGSYPGAQTLLHDPLRWRAYLRDGIVEPAIGRDILAMETIRKPALLRQVYAICAGHPAEIMSLQKFCGQLTDGGALETVAHYLHLLEEACLVAAVPKYSRKAVRQRAAPPKILVLSNALLAAASESPQPDNAPEKWGRWVENACMAFAWNSGQRVSYWRMEPLEIDWVMEGTWGSWAVEVKTGIYAQRDMQGLLEFCRMNPGVRPLLLCHAGQEAVAAGLGITVQSWQSFLVGGLA